MSELLPKAPDLIRNDWTADQILEIHRRPLPDLIFEAQTRHRCFHDPSKVQLCTLLSIKTGGCPEDCAYCPQSSHHPSGVDPSELLGVEEVTRSARQAQAGGSTRFCMGAAWREVQEGPQFEQILEMVRRISRMGLEVCCTLGMLNRSQAERLADAGLTAYNHNLDTGPEFYSEIISTRTYQDRLQTLENVRRAGITVCCGGILGMGERLEDRISLLQILSSMDPHPESVPINALVRVEGTPLAGQAPVEPLEIVRMIATARIVLPASRVRLSAGRSEMSLETQALCLLAGANSIFTGEKLLTTPNPGQAQDQALLEKMGLTPLARS